MNSTNYVVCAQGWFGGLPVVLDSIRAYSPLTKIHVIGDDETIKENANANHKLGCDIIPIRPYSYMANQLASVFTNYSPNPAVIELRCMQRWFIIYEYCKSNNIGNVWSFDWDNLIFCNLEYEAEALIGIPITMPLQQLHFWIPDTLKPWLDMLIGMYQTKNWIWDEFKAKVDAKVWDSISDGYAARWFYSNGFHPKVLDVVRDGRFWDMNIAAGFGGFVVDNNDAQKRPAYGTKRLKWENGCPYALATDGSWVRLMGMHCWGSHKQRIPEYLDTALRSRNARTT